MMKKKKILLLDDTETNRILIQKILEKEGCYEVFSVNNGEDALEKIKSIKFDLVITDIRMPIMDGIDFANRVNEINKNLPIIAITALKSNEFDTSCFSGYLRIPVEKESLVKAIKNLTKK